MTELVMSSRQWQQVRQLIAECNDINDAMSEPNEIKAVPFRILQEAWDKRHQELSNLIRGHMPGTDDDLNAKTMQWITESDLLAPTW